jgi:hypothetical protein
MKRAQYVDIAIDYDLPVYMIRCLWHHPRVSGNQAMSSNLHLQANHAHHWPQNRLPLFDRVLSQLSMNQEMASTLPKFFGRLPNLKQRGASWNVLGNLESIPRISRILSMAPLMRISGSLLIPTSGTWTFSGRRAFGQICPSSSTCQCQKNLQETRMRINKPHDLAAYRCPSSRGQPEPPRLR